MKALHSSDNR